MDKRIGLLAWGAIACAAPGVGDDGGEATRRHPVTASTPSADRVEIWHHGDAGIEVIVVDASAARAHAAHGDWSNPLWVDASAPLGGDGFEATPFRRLTDAVAAARAMRAATGDTEWAADPITVRARPGTYVGSYAPVAPGSTLEPLPLVLDVPGLVLQGAGVPALIDGVPDGSLVDPASTSRLVPDAALTGKRALLSIGRTTDPDGTPRAGNGTVVSGWTLESGHATARGGVGVVSTGVEDVVVEASVFGPRFEVALDLWDSAAVVDRVVATDTGACAVCLTGGDYTVLRSALRDSFLGIGLIPAPGADPDRAVASLRVEDSDLTGNKRMPVSGGVRVFAVGPSAAPDSAADLVVRRTRFGDSRNGVLVDGGFTEWDAPGVPRPVATEVTVALEDNAWGAFVNGPLVVTFVRGQVALGPAAPGNKPYLAGADWTIDLVGTDADLAAGAWIDHPAVDPCDPTPEALGNTLVLAGVEVPAPTRTGSFAPTCAPAVP